MTQPCTPGKGRQVMWQIMRRLDCRWFRWHAWETLRRNWIARRPRLWTFTTVPLSTWLRHPATGWESYRANLGPILLDDKMQQMAEGSEKPDHG